MRIALDAMGGDYGPAVVVPAASAALGRHPDLELVLVGLEDAIRESLADHGLEAEERITVRAASQVVSSEDDVSQALRSKRDSSIHVGATLVKEGEVDGFVSAGNTGALMAIPRLILKTLPGIDRPAIATFLPTRDSRVLMLDLGANVDCNSDHLFQFAVMGEVASRAVYGVEDPSIGLLNIGEENIKGNDVVKVAGQLLRESDMNYVGNVEGRDIFSGKADVVVADGFVGNVALKTSEGTAELLAHFLRQAFSASWSSKLAAFLARKVLKDFKRRADHREYNGAMLLGLNGIVVKSHGSADSYAFSRAIEVAASEARNNVNRRITHEIQQMLEVAE
ncbi:phosphate acyltransferase [Thiohalorhabdus denitrificans]|uniref:Phosphate acyltransferase n=1 Tax=Thiohalorhabdus denitrificans TaxID=381306 RepID=A0A0P9C563_9GAMM|nr:phosphate acyltransferase PlsX [Thiohalorhabdus denitrificans]KPV40144.1 phosphate acyltransferase [Thiohalorhabdus denitrificans]SCY17556.1 phosphate:acyl-[acyl carrier protein] acyltransferase [Thiohalorhabdus denitrificans]